MATNGNEVKFAQYSRSAFDTLTKNDDTLYVVTETDSTLSFYLGENLIGIRASALDNLIPQEYHDVTGETVDLNADYLLNYTERELIIILHSRTDGGTNNISNKPRANSFKMFRFLERSNTSTDLRVRDLWYTTNAVFTRNGSYTSSGWSWGSWKRLDVTTLSQLSTDSTHRVVTDTEKSTWNAKISAITKSMVESVLTGEITSHTHSTSSINDFDADVLALSPAGAREASDVYDWAKGSSKPDYEYTEIESAPRFSLDGTTLTITLP